MYVKEVIVRNSVGLYARPATYFIQKANEFKSSIWVEKEERRVNAKSLLGIRSLGIMGDTAIKIIADGIDEQEAVDQLVRMVEVGFTSEPVQQETAGFMGEPAQQEATVSEQSELSDKPSDNV